MIYIISISFIVSLVLGVLVISKLAERYGRLYILRISTAVTTVNQFLILAAGDAWYFTVFLVLFTIPLSGSLLLPFIYLGEVTSYYSRKVGLLVLLCVYILGYMPAYLLIYYYYS